MRLSAKERAGLRAMVELAHRYGDGLTALNEVAHAQGLPLPYLERIISTLRRAGLLVSVRGAHGGYALARPPERISVAEIFCALEGSLLNLDCMRQEGTHCSRETICATRTLWQRVAMRLSETLNGTSLGDIASDSMTIDSKP
jgi:Rrf2 family cysteine metabolism transcriptional repressor